MMLTLFYEGIIRFSALVCFFVLHSLSASAVADDGSLHPSDVAEISGLSYLGNTTFPTGERYEGWAIGGLSGIDFDRRNGDFILARDNIRQGAGPDGARQTTLFKLSPVFSAGQPGYSVKFTSVMPLNNPAWQPETNGLESVRFDPDGNGAWVSSESENVLYHFHRNGTTRDTVILPYIVTGSGGNAQLEGMTFTPDNNLWVIRETPRSEDNGITRISHINKDGKVLAQYPYQMENLSNNGVSELLAVSNTRFLVMERAWDGISADTLPTGVSHNSVRIYRIDVSEAQDIASSPQLAVGAVTPVSKTLIFDSQDLASILNTWDTKVDNIEGMSFGPALPDGHTSLILVSDDNFNTTQRKTQFVIFRVEWDESVGLLSRTRAVR